MSFLIGLIMTAKGVLFFSGSLGGSQSLAELSAPRIILSGNEIKVNCAVTNALPQDLKRLAESGTQILIYLTLDLRDATDRTSVNRAIVENSLRYDLINKRYIVVSSVDNDTLEYTAPDSALASFTRFLKVPVAATKKISADHTYYIEMFSMLGKVRVEAVGNKEIDLMYFWNFKRPSVRTEKMEGVNLLPAKKG
jgi:hypothetical protein